MIGLKELRIGNYVYNGDDQVIQINGIISKNNTGGYLLETLRPIEITEEWLLNFEFIKEDKKGGESHSDFYTMYLYDYKYSFAYSKFRGEWGLYHSYTDALLESDNNKYDFICGGIKYVHQLQNLYFALTYDDLKLNN